MPDVTDTPTKFQDEELETLLNKDLHQMLKELSKLLNIGESTVSKRLKTAEFVHKQDYRVPHVLEGV